MNLRIKNGIHKLKGIEEEEEEKLRTIGELLSRGDETSMLDSSSWTSPYILPKLIKLKTKLNPIANEWFHQFPSVPICPCCKWRISTFFQSAHFLRVRFHFLIEQWYFGWTNICSEWYLRRLNWYCGPLLPHSFMRLSFTIHFVIPIESAPILLFRWTWFTIWFRIFYKTK